MQTERESGLFPVSLVPRWSFHVFLCFFFFLNFNLHFEVHFVKKKYRGEIISMFLCLFLENLIFK